MSALPESATGAGQRMAGASQEGLKSAPHGERTCPGKKPTAWFSPTRFAKIVGAGIMRSFFFYRSEEILQKSERWQAPLAILFRRGSYAARLTTAAKSIEVETLIVPLKWIEYGVYGDLIIVYPKPYSVYLRGTITAWLSASRGAASLFMQVASSGISWKSFPKVGKTPGIFNIFSNGLIGDPIY